MALQTTYYDDKFGVCRTQTQLEDCKKLLVAAEKGRMELELAEDNFWQLYQKRFIWSFPDGSAEIRIGPNGGYHTTVFYDNECVALSVPGNATPGWFTDAVIVLQALFFEAWGLVKGR